MEISQREDVLLTYLKKYFHCEEFDLVTIRPTQPGEARLGWDELAELWWEVEGANQANFRKNENNFCRFWIGVKPFKHGEEIVWEKSGVKLHTNIINWEENQSEQEGSDDEKCVEIRDHQEWSIVSCKKSRRFICKLDEDYRVFMNLAEEMKASGLTDQWKAQCSAVLKYPL